MKFTIDGRSLMLGAGLALLCTLMIGAVSREPVQEGRYQLQANQGAAYVIDTGTGQGWERLFSNIKEDADFKKAKLSP